MVDIRPSIARRPRPDLVERVACPPYDVVSVEEARSLARGNPYSFLHVIRAEIDLGPDVDPHSEQVYRQALANLQRMIADGIMIRDDTPCFYVYRLTRSGHVQHGVVAGVSLDEYDGGRIKKHELTRPEKEADRARHIEVLGANTGPVLLAYRSRDEIDELVREICSGSEPVYDFSTPEGVGHTLWVVPAPGYISRLQEAFRSVETLFIADGHHRAAAASRVRRILMDRNPQHTGQEAYNHFLAAVFPHSQLNILGYHRVVRDLGDLDRDTFLEKISKDFTCSPDAHAEPESPRQFGMFMEGSWYRLEARPGSYPANDPVRGLDASILQENLLGPILGISDPRSDKRIDFVGGADALSVLERRCREDMRVAFCMYPLSIDQLMAVADSGKEMPPKSTWFEPKLRSGLIIRSVDGRNI